MIRLVFFALVVFLGGCAEPEQVSADGTDGWPSGHSGDPSQSFLATIEASTHFKAINGLSFEIVQTQANEPMAILAAIDLEHFTPALLTNPTKGRSVQQIMAQTDVGIVIGSGFVTDAQSLSPVGLLREGNQDLNPLEPYGYTRILGFNDRGFGVLHRKNYEPEAFTSAIQAGPGIIEQGKLDISERDLQRPKYYRSFVALCSDRVRVGVTTMPTHLRTLGQELTHFFLDNNLACAEVINLAGDRQAVLAIREEHGFVYHGDIFAPKATLLSFSPH
ncbi:MAG: hypothetical protein GKR90_01880 [Pseudomonadales bacterium]|nr:hypothetical protein [Pseudomonadales bacterium]